MSKEIPLAEVKKHKDSKSAWIVIHNDVYDVTTFLAEHPGGEDALLEVAGKDGTQGFEDVGHSDDARELLKKYKIGSLPAAEQNHKCISCRSVLKPHEEPEPKVEKRVQTVVVPRESSRLKWLLLALAGAIVIGVVLKKYSGGR